ncbi:hypothetical protein ACH5Y9_09315 [Methylomonas sp. BW4-1]|uniref:hypothetical protein n=1 Tax=Methylomonas sp. BW4-1 TaxID=3376685 RepID=UPI004040F816
MPLITRLTRRKFIGWSLSVFTPPALISGLNWLYESKLTLEASKFYGKVARSHSARSKRKAFRSITKWTLEKKFETKVVMNKKTRVIHWPSEFSIRYRVEKYHYPLTTNELGNALKFTNLYQAKNKSDTSTHPQKTEDALPRLNKGQICHSIEVLALQKLDPNNISRAANMDDAIALLVSGIKAISFTVPKNNSTNSEKDITRVSDPRRLIELSGRLICIKHSTEKDKAYNEISEVIKKPFNLDFNTSLSKKGINKNSTASSLSWINDKNAFNKWYDKSQRDIFQRRLKARIEKAKKSLPV